MLEDQEPVFLADVRRKCRNIPIGPICSRVVGRPTYVFPVSTSRKRYGLLVCQSCEGEEFIAEDVELLRSLASHVAVAFEFALAKDDAEQYQRQVVKERDRLRLLLEINNHIVSKLDINELFRSASVSIRTYFRNDFSGFWLIDKQSNQLECVVLDFPSGKGLLTL